MLDDPTDEMAHGADGKHSHIFAGMSLTAQSNPCFLCVIFAADIHFLGNRPRASGCVKVFPVIVCGQWSTAISDIQMKPNPPVVISLDFLFYWGPNNPLHLRRQALYRGAPWRLSWVRDSEVAMVIIANFQSEDRVSTSGIPRNE